MRTSDSSIMSTPIDSRARASKMWPILAFAITGMVTASMISSIFFGSAIRATPPASRMSAGTLSRAMTATAPASSATTACSELVTSMMTPPFCILAKPRLMSSVPNLSFSSLRLMGIRSPPSRPIYRRNLISTFLRPRRRWRSRCEVAKSTRRPP